MPGRRGERLKGSARLGSHVRRRRSVAAVARHRSRPSIERSELLLRLAVELGRIGIFVTDLERKRTRLSPELCDILGLPIGTEMSYAQATALIDERDRDAVIASAEAAIRSSDAGKLG